MDGFKQFLKKENKYGKKYNYILLKYHKKLSWASKGYLEWEAKCKYWNERHFLDNQIR